ncbi:MAG: hypothetical protein HC899_25960 [Leptolyngbyaceae cyanobacterium SM1_4_3]|nr:hypothetical protein [Leptolyngbyaceae cyanobacterium SM1_4_3]
MKLEDISPSQEILDVLGLHVFALHTAAEALEKQTAYSKRKWLEVLLREGIARSATTSPQDFHQALMETLEAGKVSFSEGVPHPDALPPQL